MATTPAKRPLPPTNEDSEVKRVRSNNGTPATVHDDEKERKRQEAAAKIAALKAKMAAAKMQNGGPGLPSQPVSQAAVVSSSESADDERRRKQAEVQRRIAEMKAKIAAKKQGVVASPTNGTGYTLSPPPQTEPDPLAEARRKAAELAKRPSSKGPTIAGLAPPPPPSRQDGGKAARGGLGIGLHPSLMGDLRAPLSSKARGPKFSTTRGNQQLEQPTVNPYLADSELESAQNQEGHDASLVTKKPGERKSRTLAFNEKGKFMAQANAIRQTARMEEMKKRIAEEARKTEIEEAGDKAFLVPVPPEVEWWDEGILDNIYDETGLVSDLVVHPIMLQAPQDKLQPAPRPLMLTPKEQNKLRRQRRLADQKEEQAKIRLGLIPPPPPKVKKSNMMRVLGEAAVKDPTAVEARVNKEIAQRANDHATANAERALTKEQRAEKLKAQQAGDEAKGVKIAVFRVDNLSSGKHRYQIDVNAKQNNLTGMVVLHPEMNLVIVEGGVHSLTTYKKLMLHRVKWAENTMPLANSNKPSTFTGANDGTKSSDTNKAAMWLNPMTESGELKDLGENRCQLVWEGDEAQRSFRRWGSKACETDGEARDMLSRSKMENMWTLARSMTG